MRAKVPALQFPIIIYSIFANVAFTYGPIFQTEAQAESLITKLLIGFFSAFAIATGVSLFIIPVSSRTVVQKQQAGYIQLIRGTLKVGRSRRKGKYELFNDLQTGSSCLSYQLGELRYVFGE